MEGSRTFREMSEIFFEVGTHGIGNKMYFSQHNLHFLNLLILSIEKKKIWVKIEQMVLSRKQFSC